MLIELSLEGGRISNAGEGFAIDDIVTIEIGGFGAFPGRVRWHHDGTVGIKLAKPFHCAELDRLIRFCRGEIDTGSHGAKQAIA